MASQSFRAKLRYRLDAFIGPGHVSTVIGCRPYGFIASQYGKPIVVSGFEPLDLLQAIVMILRQLRTGRAEVENQYARVVPWAGNSAALRAMADVFELRPYFEWRGLGFISQSALSIRETYAAWDTERRFTVPGVRIADPQCTAKTYPHFFDDLRQLCEGRLSLYPS